MSLPERGEADGIERGRRLVRVDTGQSLAERVIRRLQSLAWRSPLHALRLRGRHPLKLLAVPDDEIPGDPRRGAALLEGQFLLRGETVPLAGLDFTQLKASSAMTAYVHSFAWLRDLSTVATRAQGAPIAEAVMRAWLAAHASQVSEPAWQPELWGRRILFWTAHAPLILSNPDLIYRSSVLNALARGARHLDRAAERTDPGVPRIAAWAGLTAAALLLPGRRLEVTEAGLARALQTGLSGDGGVLCRAPTAQLDAVMLLAMLRAAYVARRHESPAALDAALERAVPALLAVTHGDGGLTSFQGSAPLGAVAVEAVIDATGVRARPQRQARDWGYQRMSGGATVAIVDAGPPPLARLNAGGCASTLALELSDGPHRLIVSVGGGREPSAMIPARLMTGLRSTAAHSTLVLADSNSTAIHPDGTLGRGVTEVDLKREETDVGSRVEASHDGYVRRFGLVHTRTLALSADGRELKGEDGLIPRGRRKRGEAPGFAIRFHLAPDVEAVATADGRGALLRIAGGPVWQFRCSGAALAIEESLWIDADGRPRTSAQLAVSGESGEDGAAVGWLLKRAG